MKVKEICHKIICSIFSIFFRSKTVKHILKLNSKEKMLFLRKIIDENIKYHKSENIELIVKKPSLKFVEHYNQLPCTVETRKKRADLLEKNGYRDKEILLMGDDDLLCVELASRKFKYITVLDCDKSLLNKLKILTHDAKFPITFLHIDLYQGLPNYLSKLFSVVCFDPPQNYYDLKIFLDCALKAVKHKNSSIYMMMNSNAMGEIFTIRILNYLDVFGFKYTQKFEYFNCYPLNRGQSWLLSIMSYFTHNYHERKKGFKCLYYFTDCLEFKSMTQINDKLNIQEESQSNNQPSSHFSYPEYPVAFFIPFNKHHNKKF